MAPRHYSLLAVALLAVSQVRAACYYPNGNTARSDIECSSDTDYSACCAPNYKCLSNGLCQATDELLKNGVSEFARGSCSDQSWASDDCPSHCISNNRGGGADLTKCQGYTNRFYCTSPDANATACDNEDEYIAFAGDPSAVTTIAVESTETASSTTASETTSTSVPETTSAETTAPDDTASTTSATSAASTDESTDSKSSSNGAIIGGAVGGSVGGLLVIGLGVWMLIRRRRRNAAAGDKDHIQYDAANTAPPGPLYEVPAVEKPVEAPTPEMAPVELPGYYPDERR